MIFEWDEAKRRANLAKHGVDFDLAHALEWGSAEIRADLRRDYGEERFRALGHIQDRVFVLVYTHRDDAIRVISLRAANLKETIAYENALLP